MNIKIIKTALPAVLTVLPMTINAQETTTGSISIRAIVADEDIPATATKNIETKLQRALAANGIGDMDYTQRFVLTAKVDVTSNDVVPSNPPRVSKKMDITLIVGDVIENKIYETCTLTAAGIGTNDDKAFVSAFSRINPNNEELQSMLERAKSEIIGYYTANCSGIIANAKSLSGQQKYDEAIARLMSVPDVCTECYKKCQNEAVEIYRKKLDNESSALLNDAKNEWMHSKDAASAARVAEIIGGIDPDWSGYSAVTALRNEISAKLSADEKREWEFKMKQYEDEQALKVRKQKDATEMQRDLIGVCREIGVAWGKGQPQTVTKNVIERW